MNIRGLIRHYTVQCYCSRYAEDGMGMAVGYHIAHIQTVTFRHLTP